MGVAEGAGPRGLARWGPLIAILVAVLMFSLDQTMMNVAVGAIAQELNTQVGAVQAAISLYTLFMAAFILMGARLGDLHGAKRVFILGAGLFGVGTAIAALAPSIGILIFGWSFLEGIGAALFYPLSFVFVYRQYSGTRRVFAFALVTVTQAVGAAIGPVVGGALTTFASWRWGFGMEVFFVAAIIPFASRYLRETAKDETSTMDWVGVVLSFLMLFTLILGVLLAPAYGWWDARRDFFVGGAQFNPLGLSPVPWFLLIGFTFVAAFVQWELLRKRRGQTPLLDLSIFRRIPYVLSTALDSLRSLFLAGLMFIIPAFLLMAAGFSAFESGLTLLSLTVAATLTSLTTSRLGKRIAPKYIILIGLVIMAIGTLLFWDVTSVTVTLLDMVFPGMVWGVGAGLYYTQIINLQLSYVAPEERNQASGLRTMGTQAASSLGTALIGAILLLGVYAGVVDGVLQETGISVTPEERERLIVNLEDTLAGMRPEEIDDIIAQLPPDEQAAIRRIVEDALVTSQSNAMLATFALIILAILLTTFIPSTKLEDKPMASYAEPPGNG